MNNQEAIKILKIERDHMIPILLPERIEAMDMAISALQAQDVPDTNVGDVVSRQKAIDALCRRCDLAAEDDEPCTEKCNDIKILEKLPSAQPEILRCKDCIYWWESHKMCKRNKDKNHNCACMDCDADFYCKYAERRTDERTD